MSKNVYCHSHYPAASIGIMDTNSGQKTKNGNLDRFLSFFAQDDLKDSADNDIMWDVTAR